MKKFEDVAPDDPPNSAEFADHEESAYTEDVEQSNFDPRILGDFQLGSNSSTILISNGQWV